MNFTALDFETANSNRCSICSIGLAFVENGKLVGTEQILVKPVPDYYEFTYLHGIHQGHTKNKKTFRQLWKELKPYFDNQIIVAHNAAFDCGVLRNALDHSNLKYPDMDYHCTFRLAQVTLEIQRHGLHEVAKHFKIKLKHHNAESDARASALIALKLIEKYKVNSLTELSKSLGFSVGKIISEPKSYKAFSKKGSRLSDGRFTRDIQSIEF